MRCLTVCQPYAHLIIHGDAGGLKRVENRTWATRYRGPLLIHAGRSLKWLDSYAPLPTGMTFGAILGQVTVAGCFTAEAIRYGAYDRAFPGLSAHLHVEGPWCWVLTDPRPLASPIPWSGRLGLFEVSARSVGSGG